MPWRTLEVGDRQWAVSVAAERRAHATAWCLVLSFRPVGDTVQRPIWAPYPLESSSRSMLFAQAERIPDTKLAEVLLERIA